MLEIEHLHARYGDSQVLFDLSMKVAAKSGVALLGRNGAGKSTFMKALLDAGPQSTGEIKLAGQSLNGMSTEKRARLGLTLVPEDRRIFSNLTVKQNLELALHAITSDRPVMTVDQVCELFPMLGGLLERLGYQLSVGQQQMLAVARGLMASPTILLLDEPAEGLAPKIAQDLALQVKKARENLGLTVVVAEQSISFARKCTEYIYLLDSGVVVFQGGWDSFDSQPDLKSRYLSV